MINNKAIKNILSIIIILTMILLITPYSLGIEEECVIPDILDEESVNGFEFNERLKEKENINSIVLSDSNGINKIFLFNFPIKYKDENGTIRDKSIKIGEKDKAFYSVDNDITTKISKDFTAGIRLNYNKINIDIIPECSNNIKGKQIDNEVIYNYSKDVKYCYQLTYMGYKENIILNNPNAEWCNKYELKTHGLSLKKEGERVSFCSENTEVAFLDDIYVYSSDLKNNTFGNIKITEIEENQRYEISIIIDEDYLFNEDVKYPITIDPTIEISYLNNGASAIEDATINSTAGTDGTSGSLYVGKRNNYGITRILMKFPGLDLSIIDDVQQIQSASVNIRDLMCQNESMTINCHIFNGNSWSESSVSWSNVNPNNYVSSILSSKTISYANGNSNPSPFWYDFNITNAVKKWKSGDYYQSKGIIFKPTNSIENGTNYISKTFGSYNRSSYQPVFSMTYFSLGNTLSSGIYRIKNLYSNKYLTLSGSNVMQYEYIPGTAFQKWRVQYNYSGYYTISPCIDYNMYLDVDNASNSNGTNIKIHSYNGSSAQLFRIIQENNGFKIAPKLSSTRALDVCGPSVLNRANIQLWTYEDVSQQKWTFELDSNNMTIYHTTSTPIDTIYNNETEDLQFNDKTQSELLAMGYNSNDFSSPANHESSMSLLINSCSGNMTSVTSEMISKFNNYEGGYYQNSNLTSEVTSNSNTINYKNVFLSEFETALSNQNGNSTNLRYYHFNRSNLPLITILNNDNVSLPYYGLQYLNLMITIHSWQAHSVEIKSINVNGNSYAGVLTFKFWDVFGLDENDINTYGNLYGFKSWYILQHYNSSGFGGSHKPFITYVEFDVNVNGILS